MGGTLSGRRNLLPPKVPRSVHGMSGDRSLHTKVPVAAELLAGILILQVVADGSCPTIASLAPAARGLEAHRAWPASPASRSDCSSPRPGISPARRRL